MKLIYALTLLISAVLTTAQQNATTATTSTSSTLTPLAIKYGDTFKGLGGKVLSDKVNVYLIFYGDWASPESQAEQKTFMNFVEHVSSTSWYSTFKEYTGSNGNINGPMSLSAAVIDSGSHGLNLTAALTHKTIITDAVHSGYLHATNQIDSNGLYVLLSAKNVQDSEFCTSHCGYNSYGDDFQYMYIGYPGSCPNSCVPRLNQATSPNNSTSIDAAITIFSHEIQDILTDPREDAWIIKDGTNKVELGDFCAGAGVTDAQWFGNVSNVPGTNASYNLVIEDAKYLVQTIYSAKSKACVLSPQ
ncbi:phosphate-induced protein 1 [Spinellus fusiger]|nr:phosphate-induced protein 1 [Spinellus fusiger]